MEADPGGQLGRLGGHTKYEFMYVYESIWISILMPKIISGTLRPIESDPGDHPGTDL